MSVIYGEQEPDDIEEECSICGQVECICFEEDPTDADYEDEI